MDDLQQDKNNAETEEQEQMDVAGIFRCIFCSCDVDNTDLVPVSKLIEFVQPFMLEDLNALEDLRHSLDPEGKNALVSSERFYEVMGHWSQKLAGTSSHEENDFSRSPSKLTVIDDKELPYTHSTPRASLGEKLLRCKDLLNLSNVSGYSLSTSRLDTTNPEEEVKRLEHQLSKTTNELTLTKQQLAASDEQNEQLQQDLDRLNKRLHAEQQVNEHLQKEKKINEDLRDELSIFKKTIEELKKKLSQSEKDSIYHRDLVNELDQEKLKLEKKNEVLARQNQDCLKEIFDIKTELETKEQQVTDIKNVYDELKSKFAEQKDFIDQLREENDILNYQKSTLEKVMKAKSSTSPHSNLGNLNFDFSKTPSPPHTSPNSHSPCLVSPNLSFQNRLQPKSQSKPLLRRVLGRLSSTPISHANSLLDLSVPDNVKSLPVLSPVLRISQVDDDQRQDSSEEDLSWKFQGELKTDQNLNGTVESLQTEMHMADPARISDTYNTVLFEKDEKISELEDELERVKKYLKEIEDQKNEFLTKLKEQKEMNEELLETNLKLLSKEEFTQAKMESLKNKIAQLERNGIIVENEHENSQGEVEDLKNKIKTLEAELKNKEIMIAELKVKSDSVISLKEEVASLKKELVNANDLISDYDEKLQAVMRDLGKESVEKISLEEKIKKILENIDSIKQELKCTVLKYEASVKNISILEEKLKFKDEMLEDLKNGQKQKDEELNLFKENLENKLVKEFEGKLKYSMDAEEKVLHLTQKCNQQEADLNNCLTTLNKQNRIFSETEASLKEEIHSLKTSNSKLELTVADLKSEQDEILVKRQTMDRIELVSTEIQKHLKEKNIVVEELKQLNKKMECNLNEAQLDLRQKVDEILKLRNECSKNIEINNDLWIRSKTLQNENDRINAKNTELLEKELQLLKSSEELQIEYNNLLVVYDMEVNKNTKLNKKIAEFIEEKNKYCNQYNELKKEFDNITSKVDTEEQKNRKSTLLLSEFKAKIDDLELQNKKLQEHLYQVQKKDNISQTEVNGTEVFEEDFLKIKLESDKILEELESKLNEEVGKNKNLTKDLLEMKNHLDQSNTELLKIKQKITDNETDMVTKLQQNIESNRSLTEELSKTKDIISKKDAELVELRQHIRETEEKLKNLNERNTVLDQKVANKNKELETAKQMVKDKEQVMQLNTELLKKCTDIERLLEQKQFEIKDLENINRQLLSEINISKHEKEELNSELYNAENKNKYLFKELELTKEEKEKLNQQLSDSASQITHLEKKVFNLENEKCMFLKQQQIQIKELEKAALESIQLKEKFAENEKKQSMLLEETKQKLQEEILKTRAMFNNYSLLKKERDQLSLELNDNKISLSDTITLYNKKQTELKDLHLKCSELESKVQIQMNELKELVQQHQDEIAKKNLEKNLMLSDLSNIKTSLENANSKLKDLEIELSENKKEFAIKCQENKSLTLELDEAKRKWSESFNDDGSTGSNNERETVKRKSYSRQQITIEKIKNKLEDTEHQLKLEKSRNQELKMQLSIIESKSIGNEEGYKKEIERLQEQLTAKVKCLNIIENGPLETKQDFSVVEGEINVKNEELECVDGKKESGNTYFMLGESESGLGNNLADDMEENITKCEGKSVNKFTLASRPASPDSPSLGIETMIEIPSLDLTGFADDILEALELTEESPRKKLDKEEAEKNITALTLRLLLSSNDISARIEKQTEKYRCQYEEILSLLRDISYRLRDHVCIGTAEPIMPVFVLLEDIKMTLQEVVQSAGQVGVLVYEDKMKKYWNMVTNYMAMLRQENESLRSVSRETTPTQTGSVRRRNKSTQDRGDLSDQTSHRRRRFIPCIRLTATLIFVLAFALTLSVIIQVNCRMTASESQYCPLDGVITRINMGVPPM